MSDFMQEGMPVKKEWATKTSNSIAESTAQDMPAINKFAQEEANNNERLINELMSNVGTTNVSGDGNLPSDVAKEGDDSSNVHTEQSAENIGNVDSSATDSDAGAGAGAEDTGDEGESNEPSYDEGEGEGEGEGYAAEEYAGEPNDEEHATSPVDSQFRMNFSNESKPSFTVVGLNPEDIGKFVREYATGMDTVDSVADTSMLLEYMVRKERSCGLTMSFSACSVDTNAFDRISVETDGLHLVEIPITEDTSSFYEKIEVDGITYLSCIDSSLNPEYLHRIISEATDAVYTHNEYVYTLVGPRPFNATGNEYGNKFMNTLKLNSYEMSVFISYMQQIPNVVVRYGTFDGKHAIWFTR